MATRAQIRTRARVRADQDSSTFPSDSQYNDFIDEAGREVWYDLMAAGWPVNFSSKDLTASGSSTLTLGVAGTVAFIRGVFRYASGTWSELDRLNEGDRAALMSSTDGQTEFYDFRIDPTSGPVVELLPTPSSGTYRVHYILEWPGFSADADVWYGPARSDELLVLKAAAKGCDKEGNTQGAEKLEREYGRLLAKVANLAGAFDQRNPPKIRDVQGGIGVRRDAFDYDVEIG